MLRGRNITKRTRAARFTREPLEDRRELTAAAGLSGAAGSYLAALDRLQSQLVARVDQINAHTSQRTAELDAGYQQALNDGATSAGSKAAARVSRAYNTLVSNTRKRVNLLERQVTSQFNQIALRFGRIDPAVAAVNSTAGADIQQVATAAGAMLDHAVISARGAARTRTSPWCPRSARAMPRRAEITDRGRGEAGHVPAVATIVTL